MAETKEQNTAEEVTSKEQKVEIFLKELEGLGFSVKEETETQCVQKPYRLLKKIGEVTVFIRLLTDDEIADLVITNMTVNPSAETRKGLGSTVIQELIDCAKKSNFDTIVATQVKKISVNFWSKNGFILRELSPGENSTGDYVLKIGSK